MANDEAGTTAGEPSGSAGTQVQASDGRSPGDRRRRRQGSLITMRPLPLTHHHGEPAPSGLRRFVHIWRYGIYHPDEDLLGVIDAAADSLVIQIMTAEAALGGARRQELQALRKELDDELADEVPELAVLLGIEAKISALYPPAAQRRRAWMIQERFNRVAAGGAAAYWDDRRPQGDHDAAADDELHGCDAAVAEATARQTTAAATAAAAAATLEEARRAREEARKALPETDAIVAERLERLKALRESGAGAADPDGLDQSVGRLLDAENAIAGAAEAERAAAGERAKAEQALAGARLRLDEAVARRELERAKNHLIGAERAARAPGADGASTQATLDAARKAAGAAQERFDAAAALHATHLAGVAQEEGGAGAAQSSSAAGEPPVADPTAAARAGAHGERGHTTAAEAQILLGYIHSSYIMGIAREKAVRDLMRWLMMRFWTANIVLIAVLFVLWGLVSFFSSRLEGLTALVCGLFAVAAIGRVGATMSVVQRLQHAVATNVLERDPILELTRLRTGKNGINLALFSGAVFALLMYVFFASGIPSMVGFDDGLAPTLAGRGSSDQPAEQRVVTTASLEQAVRREAAAQQAVAAAQSALDAAVAPAAPQPEGNGVDAQPAAGPAGAAAPPPELQQALTAARRELEESRAELNAARSRTVTENAATQERPGTGSSTAGGQAQTDVKPALELPVRTGLFSSIRDALLGPPTRQEQEIEARRRQEEAAAEAAAHVQCKAQQDCDPFKHVAEALGFNARGDFFKLLIWAFLAGFAERLVPDALDAIANRAGRRRRRADGTGDETA